MTAPLNIRKQGGQLADMLPASPALGANLIINIPANETWKPITMSLSITTSAVVANRILILDFKTPGGQLCYRALATNATMTAGQAWAFWFAVNLPAVDIVKTFGTFRFCYFPIPEIYLMPGAQIKTTMQGYQATDSISNVTLQAIKYIE